MQDGGKVGCEFNSPILKVWADTGGGWTEILSTSDGTYTGAGNWGMRANNADYKLDNPGALTDSARRRGGLVRME